MEDVINLTIGEPDLKTPQIISQRAAKYMMDNQLTYAPLGGIKELREEIASYYNRTYGSDYDADNVLVTVGSTEGLSTTLRGLLNPGDEVVVVRPAYPLYEALINLMGAKAVYVDTEENGYRVRAEMIEEVLTPKTKAVILNYPSNPCGTVLSKEETERIVQVILDNNIYLISDEIYSELVFSGEKFYSPSAVKKIRKKLVVINGFSKSHSMTGWRVGYVLTDKELRSHLVKVSQYTVSSPATLSQYGGLVALTEGDEVRRNTEIYEERANYIYETFTELGFDVVKPQGTFYVLLKYSNFTCEDSLTFTLRLLEATGVAVVPGKAFGVEGCIRIACTQDLKVLREAGKRVERFLKGKDEEKK